MTSSDEARALADRLRVLADPYKDNTLLEAADLIERQAAHLKFVNEERRRMLPTPPTEHERPVGSTADLDMDSTTSFMSPEAVAARRIAEHERLTTPPTDDCNCAPGIDGVVIHNSWAHTPPTDDDEREALASRLELYADQAEIADNAESEFSRDMNTAASLIRRQGPITDAQVNAGADALERMHWDGEGCGTHGTNACSICHGPSPMTPTEVARVVLEAARELEKNEE